MSELFSDPAVERECRKSVRDFLAYIVELEDTLSGSPDDTTTIRTRDAEYPKLTIVGSLTAIRSFRAG
jgi:hypothetical protein